MFKRILSIFLFPALIFAQAPTVSVPTRAALTRALTIAEADSIGTTLQHQVNASARSWGYRETGSSGLVFAYYGGPAWNGSTYTSIADGTVTLTASATNYVERTVAGAVSANTSAWTAGRLPLYKVTTSASAITAIVDQRGASSSVQSVFGRAGAITATSGDYGFSLISGTAGVAQGGTGANLSSTGGTSQVVQQTTSGGAFTVGQLAASNLSNGTTGSGNVVLATSPALVTPNLGTPSAAVLTNASGTAASLTAGNATAIGGITVTGTPAVGYVPTATSTSAATWQAAAGGVGSYERIQNGTFYGNLGAWAASGTNPPTALSGTTHTGTGSASGGISSTVTFGNAVTQTGSLSQTFTLTSAASPTLNFYSFQKVSAGAGSVSGYVKVYVLSPSTGNETLASTITLSGSSSTTGVWTSRSASLSGTITGAGTWGIRLEIQNVNDDTGGISGSNTAIVAVDEVSLIQ